MIEHVLLYDNQEFRNCTCTKNDKFEYSIKHSPKPMPLPQKMIETIEMLLWYSPNNRSSTQTFENNYLNNPVFEDAVITYYLRYLQIKPEDICFICGKKIDPSMVSPYLNSVCRKCTKIIVTKNVHETKIASILRHLRNCLAHGNFNLLSDNDFIGFDEIKGNYSAVFKLKIEKVYGFCKQLIRYPDFTISHIFQHILLKESFSVIPIITRAFNCRTNNSLEELIFAIKQHRVVRINCSRYIDQKEVESIEIIDEYIIEFDEQFSKQVQYIDLYYCENENDLVRKITKNKYVMSLKGLESLFTGVVNIWNYIDISD